MVAATLIEKGADVNAAGADLLDDCSDAPGRTALEGAAEWDRIDMVQLLLLAGAIVSEKSEFGNREYENAIKYARDEGCNAVADLIVKRRERKS